MRFGFFIPQGWRLDLVDIPTDKHWAVMRDLAAYADDSAWDSVWVYDHFHTVPVPTHEATHEAWSLMSAYAATTSRIKLGQMCTAMSYRNPVYLAKVAATADIISGGRIQMGIGGGWYEHEWRAYGYGFPSAGVRLGRLDEGVRIMRDAWRDGKVQLRRQALSGRRCDRRAKAVAGERTSAVDRRWRREGDAAYRRQVCAVHQLHL
jgi:alkanesulfonate monooxygenase SsuD/methylene tetrahydromethanopterin reductase-like flavin-dependent oxidoreductase (luciferase family)